MKITEITQLNVHIMAIVSITGVKKKAVVYGLIKEGLDKSVADALMLM